MRRLRAFFLGLALAVMSTVPAAAHTGHTSCAEFGAVSAELGAAGELGALVRSFATGAGVLSAIVAAEHGLYCES